VIMFRNEYSKWGTFSELYVEGEKERYCYVAEPPWKNNRPNVSCIHCGDYEVVMRFSPRFGWTYWIKDVVNRKWILIHPGNLAGDVELDLLSDTDGCLMFGRKIGMLYGQRSVLVSRPIVVRFVAYQNRQPFVLRIVDRINYAEARYMPKKGYYLKNKVKGIKHLLKHRK